jgi:LuxR family maltose regulon positive regulatory protein
MIEDLTRRERQILALVCRGMCNREIGRELHITVKTVEWHVSNMLGKLRAANRTEAVVVALQQGLLDPTDL